MTVTAQMVKELRESTGAGMMDVKKALVERGVNDDDIEAIGFGETAPIATNKTAKGKAENRRTEVKLKK